jgi:hypothetical protein
MSFKPTHLQIGTVKRLLALGLGYFLAGLGTGSVLGLGWIVSGGMGAGIALIRVVTALSMAYARDGKLPQTEVDTIIKKAVDEAPQENKDKK